MVILKATVRPGRTRSMITYLTGRWEDRVSIVLWNSAGDKACGHTRLRRVKQPQTSERANVRAVERLGRRRVRHLAGVFYSLVACPRRRRIQTLWTHCILCQPKRVLPRPWRFPFPTLWPEKSPQYSPKCLFSPETSQNRIHPFKGTTEAMQSLLQRISETMLNFHIKSKALEYNRNGINKQPTQMDGCPLCSWSEGCFISTQYLEGMVLAHPMPPSSIAFLIPLGEREGNVFQISAGRNQDREVLCPRTRSL